MRKEVVDHESLEYRIFDEKTIEKIKEINFEPQIDIEEDKVVIRLVFFTK